ncbi:hypothetical protein IV203_034836 [Nitzschia inconspicua]|uniref:Uncharacterized protein n=1 Tax=Nitzschia inconspicua TaxID=303405 RepID=A0A9K3LCY7_9STRA|nr:hypothetical protein IV203_034836 [Nitzschia inconspicua]
MSVRKTAVKRAHQGCMEQIPLDNTGGMTTTATPGCATKNCTVDRVPLRGVIRMINNHLQQQHAKAIEYQFDALLLQETQRSMQLRRKRRPGRRQCQGDNPDPETISATGEVEASIQPWPSSFVDVMQGQGHRFVCFLVVQYSHGLHHSKNTLSIRKLLALEYHELVTTVVVMVGQPRAPTADTRTETTSLLQTNCQGDKDDDIVGIATTNQINNDGGNVFCNGTGFALLSLHNTSILLSMLNVTQVPSVVVVDTVTGRRLGDTALLAMEHHRDHPQRVIDAWEQGKSGLSCCSTMLAIATCRTSSCVIQ